MNSETEALNNSTSPAEEILPDIPAGFHKCPRCGELASDERSEMLGVDECIACTPQKRPPLGVWDYPEGFHERNEGVGGLIIIE